MNDFLTNLVLRTLAPAPAVRPRLPSRFEPRPVAGPADTDTESATEQRTDPAMRQAELPSTVEESPPVASSVNQLVTPTPDALGASPRKMIRPDRSFQPAAETGTENGSPILSKKIKPELASDADLPARRALSPNSEARLPLTPALSHSEGEREKLAAAEPLKSAFAARASDVLPLPLGGGEGRGEGEPNPPPHTELNSAEPLVSPRSPPKPIEVHPTKATVPAPRQAPTPTRAAAVHAAPPGLPPIHVTIGRVEVRAVLPAAPAPRVASPLAPKLVLDEYLRRPKGACR